MAAPTSTWRPAPGPLLTHWAADVDPACPLPDYPRPQLVRDNWVNLNGLWDYAIVPAAQQSVDVFEGEILVPFAVESALSAVGRKLLPDQRLWYRRTFANPVSDPALLAPAPRVLLHFGAVDYQCEVWVNGQCAGTHTGGYLPFTFDITAALVPGDNELRVAVWDPTDQGQQPYGKQTLRPREIWYTAISGIWQTAWLEVVPSTYVSRLKITPDLDAGSVTVGVTFSGAASRGETAAVEVYDGEEPVAVGTASAGAPAVIRLLQVRPWSPDDPHLYGLVVRTADDEVRSYFAMRKFSLAPDPAGHIRFHLNDKPLFLYGPLDQGDWPDGLYTAPTDEALRFDLEYCKRIGVNLVRKHVKVEPARWYYHCDRLGLIVWQDMPNGGRPVGALTNIIQIAFGRPRRGKRPEKRPRAHEADLRQFVVELEAMVEHLYNVPSIAAWVPFNEGWGQFSSAEMTDRIKALDPTRAIDHASGWYDQGCGDFCSRHIYSLDLRRRAPRSDPRAFAISEFGGYGLPLAGHVWDPKRKSSIKFFDSPAAFGKAYFDLFAKQLHPLIEKGLMAAIFTQLADVEIEVNGWLTYDRTIEKIPAESLAAAHEKLIGR
jgi:beta-galactosidase/beta-glucuronidase